MRFRVFSVAAVGREALRPIIIYCFISEIDECGLQFPRILMEFTVASSSLALFQ